MTAVIAKARAIPIEGEVTRRGLKLARVGAELVGGCPVCGGKDRFAINPKKGKWNCRGCQKGGDIISLVMHVDDIEFKEAIEHLTADKVTPETGNGAAKPKLIRTLGPYEFCAPATGAVAYRKTREEYSDGSKKFFFDPPGRDPPLLYGGEQLADLGEGRRVWIVEGGRKSIGCASLARSRFLVTVAVALNGYRRTRTCSAGCQ